MNHTLINVRKASKLADEAGALLERLAARDDVKGATLNKLLSRYQRRRTLWNAAADNHWGSL